MSRFEWTDFPAKYLVLHYLDYESRCNLRICSKENRDLVDSHRFVALKVSLQEIPSCMDEEKTILRLDIDSFTIWFIGKNDVTRVERAWNGELMERFETKEENRIDVLRRYMDRFLMKERLETDELLIIGPSFEPSDNWKFRCSKLLLVSTGVPPQWVISWMQKVDPHLNELMVKNWSLEGISELPHIFQTKRKLSLRDSADLSDEQLEMIKATDLELSSWTVTPEGVKKALENYFRNGHPDDEFAFRALFPENFDPIELFPKELNVEVKSGSVEDEKM
uniref:F-box domain-containing protein n=1 Tax=Caenorhabditis tropicalis TaxID=1561998 RepID=A0A1I7UJ06_9PELO